MSSQADTKSTKNPKIFPQTGNKTGSNFLVQQMVQELHHKLTKKPHVVRPNERTRPSEDKCPEFTKKINFEAIDFFLFFFNP